MSCKRILPNYKSQPLECSKLQYKNIQQLIPFRAEANLQFFCHVMLNKFHLYTKTILFPRKHACKWSDLLNYNQ